MTNRRWRRWCGLFLSEQWRSRPWMECLSFWVGSRDAACWSNFEAQSDYEGERMKEE
jgi:hypothetical protein